jgi:4-hydroxy-tetrahydrodipicolinate synthase
MVSMAGVCDACTVLQGARALRSGKGFAPRFAAPCTILQPPVIGYNCACTSLIVRHPRIAAVKDCSGDSETTMALIEDGHAQVLAGEDLQIFNNLCLGGAGAISASAHVRADLYVRMLQQVDRGDWAAARGTFYQLLPWIKVAFAEPNPAVVKAALQMQGLTTDELREPMQSCSQAIRDKLAGVLGLSAAL